MKQVLKIYFILLLSSYAITLPKQDTNHVVLAEPSQSPLLVKKAVDRWKSTVKTKEITIGLDNHGEYPLPEELALLISSEFLNGKKTIVSEIKERGAFTAKMYKVSVHKSKEKGNEKLKEQLEDKEYPVFFLKISKGSSLAANKPWENLRKIQNSRLGRLGTYQKLNQKFPIIMMSECFFSYLNQYGDTNIIEVSHAALGKSVISFINQNDKNDRPHLNDCAIAVGAALSLFHQAFMTYHNEGDPSTWRTYSHGDFHVNNVFFKRKNDSIENDFERGYFIDTESMVRSLACPETIEDDLFSFIFYPLLSWGYLDHEDMTDAIWDNIAKFYASFIKAYVTNYPTKKQVQLASYVQNFITTTIDFALQMLSESSKGELNRGMLLKYGKKIQNKNPESNAHYVNLAFSMFNKFLSATSKNTKLKEQRLTFFKEQCKQALQFVP